MFVVIYKVSAEEREKEYEWLRSMLIVPTLEFEYDWLKKEQIVKFAMIISAEQLTVIKLRRNIYLQRPYSL